MCKRISFTLKYEKKNHLKNEYRNLKLSEK